MLYMINKNIPCQLVSFSLKVLFLFGLFLHRRWDISSELKEKKSGHLLHIVQKASVYLVYILFVLFCNNWWNHLSVKNV